MNSAAAFFLTIVGILLIAGFYLGRPDAPDWILIIGAWSVAVGVILGIRDQLHERAHRRARRGRRR